MIARFASRTPLDVVSVDVTAFVSIHVRMASRTSRTTARARCRALRRSVTFDVAASRRPLSSAFAAVAPFGSARHDSPPGSRMRYLQPSHIRTRSFMAAQKRSDAPSDMPDDIMVPLQQPPPQSN